MPAYAFAFVLFLYVYCCGQDAEGADDCSICKVLRMKRSGHDDANGHDDDATGADDAATRDAAAEENWCRGGNKLA